MELEKFNRRPWGKRRGKNSYKYRRKEANHKRLLNTENNLRVDGRGLGSRERGVWVMGTEEGTCWDEHWVLYGNQFDNKLHILKEKKKSLLWSACLPL